MVLVGSYCNKTLPNSRRQTASTEVPPIILRVVRGGGGGLNHESREINEVFHDSRKFFERFHVSRKISAGSNDYRVLGTICNGRRV